MPNTNALNPTGELFFRYPRLLVRLSPDGNPPKLDSEVTSEILCRRVVQSAGGATLDHTKIEWRSPYPLINRQQPTSFARMVDVTLPDFQPGPPIVDTTGTRLHVGDYVQETEAVGKDEKLTAEIQTRSYHFGDVFKGQRQFSPITGNDLETNHAPSFNPMVDGRILPNKSKTKKRDDGKDAFVFINPVSVLTAKAKTTAQHEPELWNLADAVLAVCFACNTDEEFIQNPLRSDLDTLFGANPPVLSDVRLPNGKHLPFLLDRLLVPLGYNWFVNYDTQFLASNGKQYFPPDIKLFKIGDGPKKKLYFQPPGQVMNMTDTNIDSYRVSRNIGDSINAVRVVGGMEKVELTIPLNRTWPISDDSLTAADLSKETGSSYGANKTVWRLWSANLAGDYTAVRPGLTAPDLSSYFESYIPHRREIEAPFTWLDDTNKTSYPQVLVEWSLDGGTTWVEAEGSIQLSESDVEILFDDDEPPAALINAGPDAQMRITGVVSGDSALTYTAPATAGAVNDRTSTDVIYAPQKFRKHTRGTGGLYASELTGPVNDQDDTTAIQDYATKLRDDQGYADLDCEMTMPGVHLQYEIGDVITEIEGREINLNAASAFSGNKFYPQVIRRTIAYQPEPVTILKLSRPQPSNGVTVEQFVAKDKRPQIGEVG